MTNKKIIDPERAIVSKYFKALLNLYSSIKNQVNDNFFLGDFYDNEHVGCFFTQDLQRRGILFNEGGSRLHSKWRWIGKKPSRQLAVSLVQAMREAADKSKRKCKKIPTQKSLSPKSSKISSKVVELRMSDIDFVDVSRQGYIITEVELKSKSGLTILIINESCKEDRKYIQGKLPLVCSGVMYKNPKKKSHKKPE